VASMVRRKPRKLRQRVLGGPARSYPTLVKTLFTLSALPALCQAFCLSENLPLNMGVKVVPKIFGADGPKITQRPPRALEHIIIR